MEATTEKKPKVRLTGQDGNAFIVLGRCVAAMRVAGWTDDRIATFREEATSGNYSHLLQTAMKYCDVK